MSKDKPAPSTSSAPAAASHDSESKDLLEAPNQPPSPQESKTPKQEADTESCSTEEKPYVHTGTLTPKPEVCMLYCHCATTTEAGRFGDAVLLCAAGAVCWFERQPLFPSGWKRENRSCIPKGECLSGESKFFAFSCRGRYVL